MYSVLCTVCNHPYVFLRVVWMCVYDSWRVLIKASHLPHNRTLSLCTCLLSYVHCGLSTSPAVRTQPQIRAVYLTTAASSPVYKHTQTSLWLSSHVDAARNGANSDMPWWAAALLALCFSFPSVWNLPKTWRWMCLWRCTPTHGRPARTCRCTHTVWMRALTSSLRNSRKQIHTHKARDACQESSYTISPHAVWHGKIYARIQACKTELHPKTVQCTADWQPSPPMHLSFAQNLLLGLTPSVSSLCRSWSCCCADLFRFLMIGDYVVVGWGGIVSGYADIR